ncbi:MAG TPA: hypothetical protein PLP01_10205 [Phycisphaerae bacterium]|nr:hypothetical protein [Phycisphaerae bacterium]
MSEAVETIQMAAGDDTIRIRIPMKLKKRAGRKEIVLPKAVTGKVPTQDALVRAVARAFHWQSLLESGEVKSIGALATRFHVDHSYVARTIRLASLAPDIVEAIVRGDESEGLTLDRLMKPWPVRWDMQRADLCDQCLATH